MDKPPLITVYITSNNYEQYIKESIESVLQQTLTDFELIIIDDGSTDNSRKIIDSYSLHPQVAIIFQHNKGLNVTCNIALRKARGKYIIRLDADDYLDENALLLMSNKLQTDDDLGLVFPDYYLINETSDIIGIKRHHSSNEVSLWNQPAHGACTMIRCKYLLDLGGYNENFKAQDGWDLWLKFIHKHKVTNVNLPLFYYRQHRKSLSSKEELILETRAKINNLYYEKYLSPLKTVAILPVRGKDTEPGNFSLEKLGDQCLIERIISAVLTSKRISILIVTSSDKQIKNFVEKTYQGLDNLIYLHRNIEQTRLNTDLIDTTTTIINLPVIKNKNFNTILLLSAEYPFVKAETIDDAINTMAIFKTDSLVSVRTNNNMLFQHRGHGLKPIFNQDKLTRLEREALYEKAGGIMITKIKCFEKERKFLAGGIGHIVVDRRTAQAVQTTDDFRIASCMAENN